MPCSVLPIWDNLCMNDLYMYSYVVLWLNDCYVYNYVEL